MALTPPRVPSRTHRTLACSDRFPPWPAMAPASPNRLLRNACFLLRDIYFMFLRATSAGSPAGVVVVVGAEDWCLAATALSIAVPVDPVDRSSISIAFELVSRAPGDGGGSGGGRGGRSWSSVVSVVVCVVMGAIGKIPTAKNFSWGPRFEPLPPQLVSWALAFIDRIYSAHRICFC